MGFTETSQVPKVTWGIEGDGLDGAASDGGWLSPGGAVVVGGGDASSTTSKAIARKDDLRVLSIQLFHMFHHQLQELVQVLRLSCRE